ncbi:MAG: sigma-70 family RNA polymerase sigma factor [Cytophagales bacterium]
MGLFTKDISDEDIIQRIQKGDRKMVDFLYKKYYKMVTNYVLKNSGDEIEAEDLFQDVIVVFWQKVTSGELVLSAKISTYLYGISHNLWQKELKRKNKYSSEIEDKPQEEFKDRDEHIKIVQEALEHLGSGCKEILMYYYFEDRSMTDIAELMGLSNADTAKSKKYKCKQELDKLLKKRFKTGDILD